jgi:hypothetical protein
MVVIPGWDGQVTPWTDVRSNANPTRPGPGTLYMYIYDKPIARVFAIILMEIYQISTLWWSDGQDMVGLLETGCRTNANMTQPGPGTLYMYIYDKIITRAFAIVLMKI